MFDNENGYDNNDHDDTTSSKVQSEKLCIEEQ